MPFVDQETIDDFKAEILKYAAAAVAVRVLVIGGTVYVIYRVGKWLFE
jgi:hypothetical protein